MVVALAGPGGRQDADLLRRRRRRLLRLRGGCRAGRTPERPVHLKKVWSYDCNPPEFKYRDGKPIPYYEGDKRKKYSTNDNDGKYVGPSQIIATPVFHEGRIYVAIGQDPAHGRGRGMLHCIDATKTGDITEDGRIWSLRRPRPQHGHRGDRRRAASTPPTSPAGSTASTPTRASATGSTNADAETWGGVLVADGKLYLGNKKEFFVLPAGKELKSSATSASARPPTARPSPPTAFCTSLRSGTCGPLSENSRLEAGDWRLKAGGRRLQAGGRRLEAGGSQHSRPTASGLQPPAFARKSFSGSTMS